MLSNLDKKIVNELYLNYEIKNFFIYHIIDTNDNNRDKIKEILVRNYD